MTTTPSNALLGIEDVARQLKVSAQTVRKLVKVGRFPPPVRISRKVHRWRSSDIEAWAKEQ